jgi:hypothetical protein
MMSTERHRRMKLLATAGAFAAAVGHAGLVPQHGALPVPEIKLSDASSFLNLLPPVQEPASIPGGSR